MVFMWEGPEPEKLDRLVVEKMLTVLLIHSTLF